MPGLLAKEERKPLIIEVQPFDIFMYTPPEQYALMQRFAEFFAALKTDVRVIAITRPFDLREAVSQLLRETRQSPTDWQRQGRDAYRRFITQLVKDVQLKSAAYFLVAWPTDSAERNAIIANAQHIFGLSQNAIREVESLPPLFSGTRRNEPRFLAPMDGHVPDGQGNEYVGLLLSSDIMGDMDFFTITRLLGQPFPIAVAVDVRTIPFDQVTRRLEMAHNRIVAQLQTVDTKDAASEAAQTSVEFTMQAVRSGEGLHQIQVAVAVGASSQAELQDRVATTKNATSSIIRLRTPIGEQAPMLRFFTTTRRPKVSAQRERNVLSSGAAVLAAAPFGYRQRNKVDGILWGVDQVMGYPVFDDMWSRKALNVVILGQTRSGKTFGALVWMYREALRGTQIIMLDPQGNCKTLAGMCQGSYAPLSMAQGLQLNLLDIVYESLPAQVAHVTACIEALLNCGIQGRDAANRRVLSPQERAAVDRGLKALYSGLPPRCRPEQMPLLANLARYLLETPQGRDLALDLEQFVTGSYGTIFNRPTNVDMRLDGPVIAFDVQQTEKMFRGLIMTLLLGGISYRIMTGPSRRRILFIDEYGVLTALDSAAGEVVAQAAAELAKRINKYKCSIWAVDQNLPIFAENPYGRMVLDNAEQVTFYHQAQSAVEYIGRTYAQLTEGHLQRLTGAQQGENVTIIGNRDVYNLYTFPSDYEYEQFNRS